MTDDKPMPLSTFPKMKTVPITDEYDIKEKVIGTGAFSQTREAVTARKFILKKGKDLIIKIHTYLSGA